MVRSDHWARPRWDVLLRLAAVLSLVASCVFISAQKPFWNDEIMGWKLITDPSIRHMLWAIAHACDGTPPVFHVSARAWVAIFGPSVLSLRLFSCAGICAALVVLWSTLRRYFSLRAVAFGVLTVWCNSTMVLTYNSEARNYGLFLALTALMVGVVDRVANTEITSKSTLAALFMLTTLLVYSHFFGLIYSGLMLLVLFGWDLSHSRFRPLVYGSIAAGWVPLLFWLPAIAREQALFRDRTYYAVAGTIDPLRVYGAYVSFWPVVLFVALYALTFAFFRGQRQTRSRAQAESFVPLVLIALSFLSVPLGFYVAQRWVHPPYADRYLLPSAIAFAILLTVLSDRMLSRLPKPIDHEAAMVSRDGVLSAAWAVLFLALIGGAVGQARDWPILPAVNSRLEQVAPEGLPIVIEEQHQWMQATFYDDRGRYFYVLDRDSAMDPNSAVDEPFFFNERTAWKAAGYWPDRVLQNDEFLCRFERFGILVSPGRLWFARRIARNPAFVLESDTGVIGGRFVVVRRRDTHAMGGCDHPAR